MITLDNNNNEPATTFVTCAFFGIGHLLDSVETFREINVVLATISFVVSITAGLHTLIKAYKRWKKQ